MKIVILGATGMFGHKLAQRLSLNHTVIPVSRLRVPVLEQTGILKEEPIVISDAGNTAEYKALIRRTRPDCVINCIGFIRQKEKADSRRHQIYLNALFPHLLSEICSEAGCRFIHFSTDCVFSGRDGAYTERFPSDAEDLYGKTKFLGEVDGANCLTLRTSAIGHELFSRYSLVEWFLSNPPGSEVTGFVHAIYSGMPSVVMADVLEKIITSHPRLYGLLHLSADPISKYELLRLIADIYKVDIQVKPGHDFISDRSLKSDSIRAELGWSPPAWRELVERMYDDYLATGYRNLK